MPCSHPLRPQGHGALLDCLLLGLLSSQKNRLINQGQESAISILSRCRLKLHWVILVPHPLSKRFNLSPPPLILGRSFRLVSMPCWMNGRKKKTEKEPLKCQHPPNPPIINGFRESPQMRPTLNRVDSVGSRTFRVAQRRHLPPYHHEGCGLIVRLDTRECQAFLNFQEN